MPAPALTAEQSSASTPSGMVTTWSCKAGAGTGKTTTCRWSRSSASPWSAG